jgi:hypothetical protein
LKPAGLVCARVRAAPDSLATVGFGRSATRTGRSGDVPVPDTGPVVLDGLGVVIAPCCDGRRPMDGDVGQFTRRVRVLVLVADVARRGLFRVGGFCARFTTPARSSCGRKWWPAARGRARWRAPV